MHVRRHDVVHASGTKAALKYCNKKEAQAQVDREFYGTLSFPPSRAPLSATAPRLALQQNNTKQNTEELQALPVDIPPEGKGLRLAPAKMVGAAQVL